MLGLEQMKIAIDRDVLASLQAQMAAATNPYDAPDDGWTAAKNIVVGAANATTDGIVIGSSDTGANVVTVDKDSATNTSIIDYIIGLGEVLDLNNAPEQGRKLVLPYRAVSLIKRSELRDASLTGDSVSMLRNGRIGMIKQAA